MEIWYRTGHYSPGSIIQRVEADRSTPAYVFLRYGRKQAKRSDHLNFFETFEEAERHLLETSVKRMAMAERRYELAQKNHAEILKRIRVARGSEWLT